MDTKAKLVQVIEIHLGRPTAMVYAGMFAQMPIELVIKSTESLLTEYIGSTKANGLIGNVCNEPVQHKS